MPLCIKKIFYFVAFILIAISGLSAQDIQSSKRTGDSIDLTREILEDAKVQAARKEVEITVRSVDISGFPNIKIMIEAYNRLGEPLDTLTADNMFVTENGVSKKVISVEKIPLADKVPVDFIFIIDKTGSMQQYINSVRSNITKFTASLVKRGIDYRIGLILFSDELEMIYNPTPDVQKFLIWLSEVKARGGGDEKENALEALEATTKMQWRPEANKVAVVVTDAPYHQKGEDGDGVTDQTTESIVELLQKNEIRVFSIVPPRFTNYKIISSKTRGNYYDIEYPFSTILDNFSSQLTNLYNLTYTSNGTAIPDSIEITLFNKDRKQLLKKTIPIVELGRKLIIENLLYSTGSANLPDSVKELDILADFMRAKPNIAIIVEGHTDDIGTDEANQLLSEGRSESVKRYLVKKGISELRIQTRGFGEKRPIASNKSEFGRRLNRRTEIIIVAK